MHRTRRLLQSSGGFPGLGPKKFLLPNDTFWDRVVSSLQGVWMHLTDQNARDKYEELVATKVIQDTVLAQSQGGHARTMALFWNLQNPLWTKHGLDVHEFVQGVGPALESFQDTLGQLVSEMNQQQPIAVKEAEEGAAESKEEDTESNKISGKSISSSIWAIPAIGGDNEWRQQAKKDPNSLAARLQKMVTDSAYDDHFFGAKLFQALTSSRGSGGGYLNYVPGSGVVQSVALLNARVLEMPGEEKIEDDHPEFAASEGREQQHPVAARMDVLYEITQQYRPSSSAASATDTVDPLSTAEQYKVVKNEDSRGDDSATTDGNQKEDAKQFSKDKSEEAASDSAKISDDSPAAAAASEPVTTAAGKTTEDKGDDDKQAFTASEASEPSTISSATAGTTTDDKGGEDKAFAASSAKMESTKEENDPTANKTTSGGGETISETTLAVAVLECWLHGGPEKDLRWKVSLIRDAYEFS